MCLIVLLSQKIVSLYDQSDQIINFYVGLSNCLFCADSSCIPSIVEFGKKVSCMPIFLLIALVCFYCLLQYSCPVHILPFAISFLSVHSYVNTSILLYNIIISV
jgi:hypothetical protein